MNETKTVCMETPRRSAFDELTLFQRRGNLSVVEQSSSWNKHGVSLLLKEHRGTVCLIQLNAVQLET